MSFVVKAVSALTAAFRLVQLDHCTQSLNTACLKQVHPDLHEDILHNLKKLSFTSVPGSPMEVEGTQHHFTRNGRLVANKQLVFQIDQQEGTTAVSCYYHNTKTGQVLLSYGKSGVLQFNSGSYKDGSIAAPKRLLRRCFRPCFGSLRPAAAAAAI